MARVEKSVLVMHSAAQMFALVDDVEKYPEFLPWCGGTQLILRDETTTTATIAIDFHGVKQHFTTQNSKVFPTQMRMQLRDGPFKTFEGLWQFTPLNETACKITFELSYTFATTLLDKMIAPVFSTITKTFVDNFVARADKLYKK